jgi:hypothetical protein
VKTSLLILGIFAVGLISFPIAFAVPSVQILMDQTTFSYGEKLFYTIEVSEITGDLSISEMNLEKVVVPYLLRFHN